MRFMITYLIIFFIFCAWLFYEQRKSSKKTRKQSEEFWERENKANHTRNKDISDLPIFHLQEEDIPIIDSNDSSVQYYIEQLKNYTQLPLIDLSKYSNTDLKLAYGVGNFKLLSDYEENFNNLFIIFTNLARSCDKVGLYDDALKVYRLSIKYGSVRASDYEEMARVFLHKDDPEALRSLITEVKEGDLPRKENIINSLKNILLEYQ